MIMEKEKRKWIIVSCMLIGLLFIGEVILRQIWGFANAPLYETNDKWEYMVCPNQDGYRFGNHYHYNSYGQRSEDPDSNKTIILGLGDSVLHGGMTSDQDSTATYIFNQVTGMQMLNISAASWGPDNCAAYLNCHGTFGAKAMFLLVSSHDAYDNMDFQPVVGHNVSYPDKQYWCAWAELIHRYVWPRTIKKWLASKESDTYQSSALNDFGSIHKNGKSFNSGFDKLKQIADSAQIPFIVCLHPEMIEVERGKYNLQGEKIVEWCKKNEVLLIKELNEGITTDMYRDIIHTNDKGQRFQAELMNKYLSSTVFNDK